MVAAMSVLVRIAYDGAGFHGFARQAGSDERAAPRTVQGAVEEALSRLYQAPVRVRGASRTDAGVHALGQLIAFEPPSVIPTEGLLRALQRLLPGDLSARAAWTEERAEGAPVEPRHENGGKRYRYVVRTSALRAARGAAYEWHLRRRLDLAAMQAAASHLVGEHDFASFRGAGCQAKTTTRRLRGLTVRGEEDAEAGFGDPGELRGEGPARVVIEVDGEAFLYNMVRIIAGTLVEVGRGRRPPGSMPAALAARDRRAAGMTAPAGGLTLVEVLWPGEAGRRDKAQMS